MTVAAEDAIDKYTAAGAEPSFAYTFPLNVVIAPAPHAIVVQVETSGVLLTLVENTDFTVTGAGNPLGGTIVLDPTLYPFGATAGTKWTLYREKPITRVTDFQISGDFFAADVNAQLDNIIQIIQDFGRDKSYSIKLPLSGDINNVDAPSPVNSGVWRWNETGTAMEAVVLTAAGITDVVLDTTPQLGGDLDVNGKKFVTVSNGNIHFEPNGTGKVGIGLAPTDGLLHVQTASAGAAANALADEAVFEGSGDSGISVLSGIASSGWILFGDSGANDRGAIQYSHNLDVMALYTSAVERIRFGASEIVINEPGNDVDLRVESDGNTSKFKVDAGQNLVQVAMGEAATALSNVGGYLFTNNTASMTTAVTTEETLFTYTLPANCLSALDKGIKITFCFTAAANTNSKTFKVYFGAKVFFNVTSATSGWIGMGELYVYRRGVGSQFIYSPNLGFSTDAGVWLTVDSAAEDETGTIVIKMTGQNGVASAGDIVGQVMAVEAIE